MGLEITRVSRHKRPGIVTYPDVNSEMINNAQLIINTTPLGMYPAVAGKPDIDYSSLGRNHILFDLVYNPEKTSFLRKGEEQGSRILSGLTMLRSQAEKAWEIWNDDNI
jgi:shikimate dehydrogenase